MLPENVRWEPADWHRRLLSDADVRETFRAAAVVAVPVKDVPQPSGQSVTLQASSCARPVVLTRTRGIWDPDGLRDGDNVVLVPPADVDALSAAISRLLDAPATGDEIGRAARATVEATASVESFAERLLGICERALRQP
jgi:glycosyltransferase involved in cell wall biosynthesis